VIVLKSDRNYEVNKMLENVASICNFMISLSYYVHCDWSILQAEIYGTDYKIWKPRIHFAAVVLYQHWRNLLDVTYKNQ